MYIHTLIPATDCKLSIWFPLALTRSSRCSCAYCNGLRMAWVTGWWSFVQSTCTYVTASTFKPTVEIVVVTSPSLSLYKTVDFPAANFEFCGDQCPICVVCNRSCEAAICAYHLGRPSKSCVVLICTERTKRCRCPWYCNHADGALQMRRIAGKMNHQSSNGTIVVITAVWIYFVTTQLYAESWCLQNMYKYDIWFGATCD